MGKEVKKLPSHMFVLLKVQSPLGKGFENIRSYHINDIILQAKLG